MKRPPGRSTLDFAKRFREIHHVFDHLDAIRGIELGLPIGDVQGVRYLTLDPRQLRAKFARRSKLIRAEVDRRNTAFGADEPPTLIRIKPTTATDLQHSLAGAQIESFQHCAAPSHHVFAPCQGTLKAAHFVVKRDVCHGTPP